jgi:YD repeat-containing protein
MILLSCTKEKAEDPCHDPSLIRQIKMGSLANQAFTYNNNCQIFEFIEPYSYKKFTYNNLNQLTKIEQAQSINPLSCAIGGADDGSQADPRKAKITQYYEFEYNSTGTISKRSNFYIYNDVPQLNSYQIYHYTNNQTDSIKTYNPSGQMNLFSTYFYDNNGNINKEAYYIIKNNTEKSLLFVNEYTYDDKNNPYQVLAGEGTPGIFTNKNNILSQTYTYFVSGSEDKTQNSYTYEYNSLGNPVKINTTDVIYGQ